MSDTSPDGYDPNPTDDAADWPDNLNTEYGTSGD